MSEKRTVMELPEGAELVAAMEALRRGMEVQCVVGWRDPNNGLGHIPSGLHVVARPKPEPTWQERLLAEHPDALHPERVTAAPGGWKFLVLRRWGDGEAWARVGFDPWPHPDVIAVWSLIDGTPVLSPQERARQLIIDAAAPDLRDWLAGAELGRWMAVHPDGDVRWCTEDEAKDEVEQWGGWYIDTTTAIRYEPHTVTEWREVEE